MTSIMGLTTVLRASGAYEGGGVCPTQTREAKSGTRKGSKLEIHIIMRRAENAVNFLIVISCSVTMTFLSS